MKVTLADSQGQQLPSAVHCDMMSFRRNWRISGRCVVPAPRLTAERFSGPTAQALRRCATGHNSRGPPSGAAVDLPRDPAAQVRRMPCCAFRPSFEEWSVVSPLHTPPHSHAMHDVTRPELSLSRAHRDVDFWTDQRILDEQHAYGASGRRFC